MGAPSMQQNIGANTTSSTGDRQQTTATNSNATVGNNCNLSDLVATYTSLIQQYLSVMCLDNATFLAERLVATSKTCDTLYLLALCYDRSGSPQRALSVLEECKTLPTTATSSNSSIHHRFYNHGIVTNNNISNSAAHYLMAKCSYDLKQYGQAEDALLQPARTLYRQLRIASDAAGTDPPMPMDAWILSTTPCPIPNGAAGLYLLGNICRRSNRKQRAMQYYHMSLQLDPLLWSSYEALCEMGCNENFMDPLVIFGMEPSGVGSGPVAPTQWQQQHQPPNQHKSAVERGVLTPNPYVSQTPLGAKVSQVMDLETPTSASSLVQMPKGVLFRSDARSSKRGIAGASETFRHQPFDTPNLTPIPVNHSHLPPVTSGRGHDSSNLVSDFHQHHDSSLLFSDFVNPSVVRRAHQVASQLYYEPSPEASVATPSPLLRTAPATRHYLRGLDKPPASNRLSFSSVIPEHTTPVLVAEASIRRTSHRVYHKEPTVATSTRVHVTVHGRKPRALFPSSENRNLNAEPEGMDQEDNDHPRSGNDKKDEADEKECKTAEESEDEPLNNQSVSHILKLFSLLGAAHWSLCQAVHLFKQLPESHLNTGWVLHQVGRAHFEMVEYQNAHRAFERMQQVEPHRMKGLEVLSTVLWHLKKEVDLAHLAQRAVDFDRLCPEAWCVVGNCFSLQKEHETALVYLGRSIQLDANFTYSHTLSGYEYLANEDFDKAVACFRTSIRTDDRHYNAWYGLGAIYHKQEKYDLAEYHFHRAVSINPQSSVLRCNLGMAQHANGKPYEALDTLAAALQLDPRNPQARYQRATIYMSMDRPEEALEELERVRDAAPREASVHFALGRVLKRLARPHQAMKCFLTALDLDPKDNQLIKSAMDKLDEPDVDEEVVAF